MSSTTGQPRNRRYIRPSQQRKTKLCWPENSIEHQNVYGRRSSSSSASITYVSIRTSEAVRRRSSSSKQQCEYKHTCVVYTSEADFHKPGIYGGRVRVWANELDVFHCTPSRGGRVFGGISFFFFSFSFERTRPTASSTIQPCLMYLSTSIKAWKNNTR